MGSLERRLRALESDPGDPGSERLRLGVHREVLRRLTDEELERYHDALEAAAERGDDPPVWREEDLPILRRVEELWEEVERERAIE